MYYTLLDNGHEIDTKGKKTVFKLRELNKTDESS